MFLSQGRCGIRHDLDLLLVVDHQKKRGSSKPIGTASVALSHSLSWDRNSAVSVVAVLRPQHIDEQQPSFWYWPLLDAMIHAFNVVFGWKEKTHWMLIQEKHLHAEKKKQSTCGEATFLHLESSNLVEELHCERTDHGRHYVNVFIFEKVKRIWMGRSSLKDR